MSQDKTSTASSVQAALKSAGTLIGLKAERTKLTTIVIPQAYAALGTTLFAQRRHDADFPELYSDLDRLADEHKRLTEAKQRAAAGSLGDRAQQLLEGARDLAAAKTASFQFQRALTRLGEAAFTKYGSDVADPASVRVLLDSVARLAAIDGEMPTVSQSLGKEGKVLATQKRMVMAAGGVCLFTIAAVLFLLGGWLSHHGAAPGAATKSPRPSGAKALQVTIEHPQKRSPSFQLEVPVQNSFLSDMTCMKTEDGELVLTFTISGWHRSTGLQGWPMIVRLFDRNGSYLTHFTTERFALAGMVPADMHAHLNIHELEKGTNTLTYQVNMRDLREAEIAEISFLDTAMWARRP